MNGNCCPRDRSVGIFYAAVVYEIGPPGYCRVRLPGVLEIPATLRCVQDCCFPFELLSVRSCRSLLCRCRSLRCSTAMPQLGARFHNTAAGAAWRPKTAAAHIGGAAVVAMRSRASEFPPCISLATVFVAPAIAIITGHAPARRWLQGASYACLGPPRRLTLLAGGRTPILRKLLARSPAFSFTPKVRADRCLSS